MNTGNGRAKLSPILSRLLSSSSRSDKRSAERVNADYSTPKTQWQALRNPATRSGHSSNGPYEGRAVSSRASRVEYVQWSKRN